MSTGTVRACERSIVGSDAAGGDGGDVPPPPVERAPGGSVLRASTPWGVLHRSTEHRAVGGNRMARGMHRGGGPWSSACRALCWLPAAPQPSLGPCRTPTGPVMQGVAVESRKYEVGREQDAKGVVEEHRSACRGRRLGPAETETARQESVEERGNARSAHVAETYPARLLARSSTSSSLQDGDHEPSDASVG